VPTPRIPPPNQGQQGAANADTSTKEGVGRPRGARTYAVCKHTWRLESEMQNICQCGGKDSAGPASTPLFHVKHFYRHGYR